MRLCERLGIPNAITGDMGGTSFDVSLIRGGKPEVRNETLLKSYTVRCPNIDIISVGAGGGSLAWIDEGGGVHVGPASAGADRSGLLWPRRHAADRDRLQCGSRPRRAGEATRLFQSQSMRSAMASNICLICQR